MWKPLAVVGLFCGMGAAVVLAQAPADSPPATAPLVIAPPVHPLPIVATWDQLVGQDPINADVGPVRLGIEATTAPAYGAVMVYARLDHINAATKEKAAGGTWLGPLMVRVTGPGMPGNGNAYLVGDRKAYDEPSFFAAEAAVGAAGDYTVEVCDGGLAIARAQLVVGPEEAPRWNPLSGRDGGAGSPTFVQPVTLDREPAVPWHDGSTPSPAPTDGKLPRTAAPDKPSEDFQLSVNGQDFTITRWPAGAFLPMHQLLAAFYVNGKRYQPARRNNGFGSAFSGGTPKYDGPYHFHLVIDPVEVGGKPGDKVEMELLCCPQGFEKLNESIPFRVGAEVDKSMVLSNRVVLTFPQ